MGEISLKTKKNFKIAKKCPFCPMTKYAYVYKRWFGLLRHVELEHLFVGKRDSTYSNSWAYKKSSWKDGVLLFIRVWLVKYSDYYDIDISSPEECEQMLYAYVTDNPSFRLPEPKKVVRRR